jgi:RimJ/RimL family protein N-acetyltransferase
MAHILQSESLQGKFVNLREIKLEDAEFVLKLRCDEKKSKYLHKTENNLQKQIDYIKRYLDKDNEWYFIIENKQHRPIGTVRIYDVKGKQFTGGSWLMEEGATANEVLEGSLLVRNYAFNVLGFEKDFYDVRKENKKVLRFHKICGAKIVGESDIDFFFEYTKNDFEKNRARLFAMLGA